MFTAKDDTLQDGLRTTVNALSGLNIAGHSATLSALSTPASAAASLFPTDVQIPPSLSTHIHLHNKAAAAADGILSLPL